MAHYIGTLCSGVDITANIRVQITIYFSIGDNVNVF